MFISLAWITFQSEKTGSYQTRDFGFPVTSK